MSELPCSPESLDRLVHVYCCLSWVFVFPESKNGPTGLGQFMVRIAVSSLVAINFGGPVWSIGFRLNIVCWASMPEAAVEEDRDVKPRKHDVGCPPNCGDGPCGYPEPQTHTVDSRTQRLFRSSVTTSAPKHSKPYSLGRRPRVDSKGHPASLDSAVWSSTGRALACAWRDQAGQVA